MQKSLDAKVHSVCLLEMEASHLNWYQKIGLEAVVMENSSSSKGENINNWFQQNLDTLSSETYYYLSGNAKTIKAVRKLLRLNQIPSKMIVSKPYWSEGKKGM